MLRADKLIGRIGRFGIGRFGRKSSSAGRNGLQPSLSSPRPIRISDGKNKSEVQGCALRGCRYGRTRERTHSRCTFLYKAVSRAF